MLVIENLGKDEWWCNWFMCPECKKERIAYGFNFCPDCGIKLEWKPFKDYTPKN